MSARKKDGIRRARKYARREDAVVRIILKEMSENAATSGALWSEVLDRLEDEPAIALDRLIDLEIVLSTFVRIERRDALRSVRRLISRLSSVPGLKDVEYQPAEAKVAADGSQPS